MEVSATAARHVAVSLSLLLLPTLGLIFLFPLSLQRCAASGMELVAACMTDRDEGTAIRVTVLHFQGTGPLR